ncbi:MAG: PepSY domain-containing protein [Nitrospira sp.]|nr:PepSY domain-containing protein [Nitrospira sp.]
MRTHLLTAILTIGTVAGLSVPAWSGKHVDLLKDTKVTIDQAIKTALEKVPGTAVEAEIEKKHGKTVWEVEIVGADGKVTEVHIDAATGEVIDTEAKKGGKKGK